MEENSKPLLADEKKTEGLSTNSAALAFVSTIIGGGIVGLPYATLLLGLVAGVVVNIIFCYVNSLSGTCYL